MTMTAQTFPSLRAQSRSVTDWLFAAVILLAGGWAYQVHRQAMINLGILVCAIPSLIALGWAWSPLRGLMVASGLAAWAAMGLHLRATDGHGADLLQGEQVFWLKYILSSQSAILWMSVLFFMSTLMYWLGVITRSATPARLASRLTWAGVFMALVGTLVRWFESHQIAPDIGHIPVSNLYEVFVLFAWMTALFWLYFEDRFAKQGQALGALGAFVMLVVSGGGGLFALVRLGTWGP